MPEKEIKVFTKGTLAVLSVTTGFTLPETHFKDGQPDEEGELMLNILIDQLTKVLIERYRTLTFEEIKYAFRNYADQVQDWGKHFNLNLFHRVMKLYLEDRAFAISDEERMLELPEADFYKPNVNDTRRVMVENAYQDFLKGSTSFNPLPTTGINILLEDRLTFFTEEEFLQGELIERFIEPARSKLIIHASEIQSKGWLEEINELKKEGNVKVENLARKMALMKAFYDFRDNKFKNIYEISEKYTNNGKG